MVSAQIKIDPFPQMRVGWWGSWGKTHRAYGPYALRVALFNMFRRLILGAYCLVIVAAEDNAESVSALNIESWSHRVVTSSRVRGSDTGHKALCPVSRCKVVPVQTGVAIKLIKSMSTASLRSKMAARHRAFKPLSHMASLKTPLMTFWLCTLKRPTLVS